MSLITLELQMITTRPLATFKLLFNNMSVWSKYGDGGSGGECERERVDGECDCVTKLRIQEMTGPTAEQASGTGKQGQTQ